MTPPPDWERLLGKDLEQIERPKPLPVGTYTMQVESHRFDESSKKKTPFVEFTFICIGADSDVDSEQLAEIKDLSKRKFREAFYLTEAAEYRLKEFLEMAGVSVGGGRTFADALPDTTGATVKAYFRQTPTDDGHMRSEIAKYAALEDD